MGEVSTKTAAAKVPVAMTDGSTVEFGAKQKLVKTQIFENGEAGVRLDFRNGEVRTFIVPAALLIRAAAHGISQKLGDAVTSEESLDDAVITIDELIEQLGAGNWAAERKAGSNAGVSVLLKAIVELSGKPVEEVRTFLSTKTQAEKIALRRSERLKPIIERLEADKQRNTKSTVDTEALLSELGGADTPVKKKAAE